MVNGTARETTAEHVWGVDDDMLVLHIDDEPQFCELVTSYLERLDDSVTVISEIEPTAGLERLEDNPIDCIVSDFQMPQMDGLELLTAVREEYPNLPFILFTGHGSENIASKAINMGVTTYLKKNGNEVYNQLMNHVQNAVGSRRSERQARITQDRIIELYEQTDGFFTLDDEWTITYWNHQIATRTGRNAEEVLGKRFLEAFPDAEGTELYENYRVAMTESESVEFETFYEPHEYWVKVRVYPVADGLCVHSRDITEEKAREEELQTRNHILKSFASTVSHDLRNPLNIAEGQLQLAQETGDFKHLEAVAQAHNRMNNLIDELLRIARGKDLELEAISLLTVAEDAWSTVSAEGTALVVVDDVECLAQTTQLRRLFENLYWNAVEHGAASEIRVGTIGNEGIFIEDDASESRQPNVRVCLMRAIRQKQRILATDSTSSRGSPSYTTGTLVLLRPRMVVLDSNLPASSLSRHKQLGGQKRGANTALYERATHTRSTFVSPPRRRLSCRRCDESSHLDILPALKREDSSVGGSAMPIPRRQLSGLCALLWDFREGMVSPTCWSASSPSSDVIWRATRTHRVLVTP
nr:response regulator [Haloferax sp. ATB1]